jgi:hypothetical protein
MRSVWKILLIALSVGVVQAQQSTKPKTTSLYGTVVAVDTYWPLMGCYHVCGFSLIVRIHEKPVRYAKVHVAYMDDRHTKEKGPHRQLIEQSKRWRFKVTLADPPGAVLEKNWKLDNETDPRRGAWWLLKGAENENLPFGEIIPHYYVEVGKYKLIRKQAL